MTHTEQMAECLKALNSTYIRPHERRAGVAWMASHKTQLPRLLARTQTLIGQHENDPGSLENWGSSQKVSRAAAKLTSDLSQPTRFWKNDNQTSI